MKQAEAAGNLAVDSFLGSLDAADVCSFYNDMYSHLATDDDDMPFQTDKEKELGYTEIFLARDSDEDKSSPYYVAPGDTTTASRAFHE